MNQVVMPTGTKANEPSGEASSVTIQVLQAPCF